jgi:hypothetical protein
MQRFETYVERCESSTATASHLAGSDRRSQPGIERMTVSDRASRQRAVRQIEGKPPARSMSEQLTGSAAQVSASELGRQDVDYLTLDQQVCFALAVASRSVISLYRPLLEPLGPTHPQYLVMVAMWENEPLCEGDQFAPPAGAAVGLASIEAAAVGRVDPAAPRRYRRALRSLDVDCGWSGAEGEGENHSFSGGVSAGHESR